MKVLLLLLLIALFSCPLSAQDNSTIMEPIHILFEGMKRGDSAMVHSAFRANPTMGSVFIDKAGQPALKMDGLEGFLKSVGTPHKDVWNEVIWSPKIEVDGNLAQVWVPYGFFINATFNHCGVDAFHLFKDASGKWKIFHLVDTRQKEGCNVPKELSDKLK
ncbi:hypothetical protein BH09BAC3_BH09BAC3_08210 [soil metagenome]